MYISLGLLTMKNLKTSMADAKVKEVLDARIFTVKDTEWSYRMLNHWTEVGLLEDARKDDNAWRKLSIADVFWIKILIALRAYGLSIEQLRVVRGDILDIEGNVENIIACCSAHVPLFMIVSVGGEAEIYNRSFLRAEDLTEGYPDGIRINLNRIWYELTGEDFKPYSQEIGREWLKWCSDSKITKTEMHVLALLRDKTVDEIRIDRGSNQKDFKVDTSKIVSGAVQISKELSELGYGEMFVKVENGRPTYTKLTRKKKLPK